MIKSRLKAKIVKELMLLGIENAALVVARFKEIPNNVRYVYDEDDGVPRDYDELVEIYHYKGINEISYIVEIDYENLHMEIEFYKTMFNVLLLDCDKILMGRKKKITENGYTEIITEPIEMKYNKNDINKFLSKIKLFENKYA